MKNICKAFAIIAALTGGTTAFAVDIIFTAGPNGPYEISDTTNNCTGRLTQSSPSLTCKVDSSQFSNLTITVKQDNNDKPCSIGGGMQGGQPYLTGAYACPLNNGAASIIGSPAENNAPINVNLP